MHRFFKFSIWCRFTSSHLFIALWNWQEGKNKPTTDSWFHVYVCVVTLNNKVEEINAQLAIRNVYLYINKTPIEGWLIWKLIWICAPKARAGEGEERRKRKEKKNEIEYRERARPLRMPFDVACGQINSKRLNPGISNWIYWTGFYFFASIFAFARTFVQFLCAKEWEECMQNIYTYASHAHGASSFFNGREKEHYINKETA